MIFLKKILYFLLFSSSSLLILPFFSSGEDLLEKGFDKSKSYENVVDVGDSPQSVGSSLTKGGKDIVTGKRRESLLVKTSKFLLRITLVVGISMIIVVGIYFLLSLGDESKMKSARNALFYIVLGIVLALSSIAIIYLLSSLSKSTINI